MPLGNPLSAEARDTPSRTITPVMPYTRTASVLPSAVTLPSPVVVVLRYRATGFCALV